MIVLKDGENAKIEVIKVCMKLLNYFLSLILNFFRIPFLLTFYHLISEQNLLQFFKTVLVSQRALCSEGAARTRAGNE